MAKSEGIVPAASLQANMAIASLDIASDVFSFADVEILDAHLVVFPEGIQMWSKHQSSGALLIIFILQLQ